MLYNLLAVVEVKYLIGKSKEKQNNARLQDLISCSVQVSSISVEEKLKALCQVKCGNRVRCWERAVSPQCYFIFRPLILKKLSLSFNPDAISSAVPL